MNDQTEFRDATSMMGDDEISISELIQKLWKKRGLIVFLPLILAGLTVAGLLGMKVTNNEELSYYVELTGVKNGEYPNGVAFSPQDLLNPSVVSKVTETLNITSDAAAELSDHIRVQFGTPTSLGILTEYKSALDANSKASPEEIALINERYQSQIKAAAQRGLNIAVDYTPLGLSKSEGVQLAYKLPEIWNQVFASEFKIFVDSGILGLSASQLQLNLSTTVGVSEADIVLDAISEGADRLRNDARFRAIQNDGVSAADLTQKLSQFRSLYFDPIYSSSFKDKDGLSSVYRRDFLLKQAELDSALKELDSRIIVIKDLQKGSSNNQVENQSFNNGGSQMQLESGALGQLVSLSRAASLSEYLQESLNKRLEIVQTKARITTRLAKMGDVSDPRLANIGALNANFYASASERLQEISLNYAALLKAAQDSALAETPALYQVMTPVQGQRLLERRDFLFIALALALGGMLAVISALLWPSREKART